MQDLKKCLYFILQIQWKTFECYLTLVDGNRRQVGSIQKNFWFEISFIFQI